jgi:hypothetical protein
MGPSAPERFVKMPLLYERAFGGVDVKSNQPERDWDWRANSYTGGLAMLPLSKTSQEPAMVDESTGFSRLSNVSEMEVRRMRLGIEVDSEMSMHDAEVWERKGLDQIKRRSI